MGKFIDLTGMKFGRLTVIKRVENRGKIPYWLCQCECGIEKEVSGGNLRSGEVKSCGCLQKEAASEILKTKVNVEGKIAHNFIDLTGQKFGRLTVISRGNCNYTQQGAWICQCDCGNITKDIPGQSLRNGSVTSCGCYRKELSKEFFESRWADEKFRVEHSGENSPQYRHDLTDEDRQDRRLLPGYDKWQFSVKEQGNFICDICGYDKTLVSHHLDGYNWCKEKRTDVSNGVCLCTKCHKEFHRRYGQGNNTKEQYIEFKKIMLRG